MMTAEATQKNDDFLPIMGFGFLSKWLGPYGDRRVFLMLFLGFSSGLPLALTASTLGAWLMEAGIDKSTIGITALISLPYTLKPLWAPFMDGTHFPILHKLLGRRRSWLIVTQLALVGSIALLAMMDPTANVTMFMLLAVLISFSSASQDIVVDAYRIERIVKVRQAAAAALYSLGYRVAMLIAGAGALVVAQYFQEHQGMDFLASWQSVYLVMAALGAVGIVTTLFIAEPESSQVSDAAEKATDNPLSWFQEYYVAPFVDFIKRQGWIHILLFVALFRLADAYLGIMFTPFLLDIGFEKTQIAIYVKTYGMFATMGGAVLGGLLVAKYGIYRVLMTCGFLHMLTNLLLVVQANLGANVPFLAISVISENATAGMTSGAFIAYLSSLCNARYSATQYALLSALAAIGRTFVSSTSGVMAEMLGWAWFFAFSSLLALPALWLLWYIHRRFGMEDGK